MHSELESVRDAELEALRECLTPGGPWVSSVHGIGGIGKSTLLREFVSGARADGHHVVALDCGGIEPTEGGFLAVLAGELGVEEPGLQAIREKLDGSPGPLILTLDRYESFRLMDTWLRQTFLPAVAEKLRLVIAGRTAPPLQWVTDPTVGDHYRSLRLDTLTEDRARKLLAGIGVAAEAMQPLLRACHGHPLALRLAAVASGEIVGRSLEAEPLDRVLRELTRFYVEDIEDASLREAVAAACTVRRVNAAILAAMLGVEDASESYRALEGLHFVETRRDGLNLHDAVREFVAAELQARDPARFAGYRRAAWRRLRSEIHHASSAQLWRYTADLIYLIENPVIREAFFPSAELDTAIEPARSDDVDDILEISRLHEPAEATRQLEFWWERYPDSFSVARSATGEVQGFYCSLDSTRARRADLEADPLTRRWLSDLRSADSAQALFLRRWLSREDGEKPSPVQAACWLDLKRSYLELRPRLRRVYLTLHDLTPYLPVAARLGFVPLAEPGVRFGEASYSSAVLDFGPRSVDGWMRRLFTHELGELGPEPGALLDLAARQLLTPTGPQDLSRLEFGVLRFLVENEGEAVSRAELLADVWDIHHDGSSNVVDTVVRNIRNKLGAQADRIESVRGVGYRCVPAP